MKTETLVTVNLLDVRVAFTKLTQAFYSASTNWAERLLSECIEEERSHRSWGPDFARHHPGAASVKDCARVFAVKRIAEALIGGRRKYPRGQEYLHCQKSWFTACGMADEFGKQIRKAWRGLDLEAFAALDYCEFVRADVPKETEQESVAA